MASFLLKTKIGWNIGGEIKVPFFNTVLPPPPPPLGGGKTFRTGEAFLEKVVL